MRSSFPDERQISATRPCQQPGEALSRGQQCILVKLGIKFAKEPFTKDTKVYMQSLVADFSSSSFQIITLPHNFTKSFTWKVVLEILPFGLVCKRLLLNC